MNKGKLDAVWSQFKQKLKKEGIVLPTDNDGHAVPGRSSGKLFLEYVEDIDKINYNHIADKGLDDPRGQIEQEQDFRSKFEPYISAIELDLLVDVLVYNLTFKKCAEKHNFIGGAQAAHHFYKTALQTIKERYYESNA